MSFLRCHWSVENISRLHFTPNESKVARPERINWELVHLIWTQTTTSGLTNNRVSRILNTGNEIGFIKTMSREHIRQTFNTYLLFLCSPHPSKRSGLNFIENYAFCCQQESNKNFDEHCTQLTLQYRQNQVTAKCIPESKTVTLF